jgi:hypothetical protein
MRFDLEDPPPVRPDGPNIGIRFLVLAGLLCIGAGIYWVWTARLGFSSREPSIQGSPQRPNATVTDAATPEDYVIKSAGAVCGDDLSKTALAYSALQNGDKEGVVGLAGRGQVEYLTAGTKVAQVMVDGEWSRVSVRSGHYLGGHCWIATGMLK